MLRKLRLRQNDDFLIKKNVYFIYHLLLLLSHRCFLDIVIYNNYTPPFFLTGAPSFTKQPQTAVDVNEGSNLLLKFYMNGNPKPSAYFKWPHLGEGWSEIFPIVQAYPFVYFSIYKFNEVDGNHCGRTLLIKITNGIGSPPLKKSTHVSVKREYASVFQNRSILYRGKVIQKENQAKSHICLKC